MSLSSLSRDGMTDDRRLELAPSRAEVTTARRFVTEWLASHTADRQLIGDAELVTSELVTNAVEHGRSAGITIHLGRTGSTAILSVTSGGSGDDLAPAESWALAGPDSVTGRGLGIVRRLAHSVDVTRGLDSVTVTVGFELS